VRTYYDEVAERRKQEVRLVEPSSKLDALMELIDGLEWDEDRRDQLVVFSNFRDPIDLACERFKEQRDKNGKLLRREIPYIRMDQKDNDRTRYEKWAIEFPKKEHQVFICTLQLGSESISLTSATTCVFLDRSWSPKDNEQGVSRVWRPGQEDVANIVHINARDTTDKRIEEANVRKIGWFKEIFGQEDNSWLDEVGMEGQVIDV
jgi:SNF2 family DNA or RNA helicase